VRLYSCLICQARKAHAHYYIFICDLTGPTIIFHIISQNAPFLEKNFIAHKMCCDFHYKEGGKESLWKRLIGVVSDEK